MNQKISIKNLIKVLISIGMAISIVFCASLPVTADTLVDVSAELIKWKDISGYNVQGMCMDNKNNVYVAKLNKTQVQIYKITSKGQMSKVIQMNDLLGHANDMTYCPTNGYIYVATGGDANIKPAYGVIAFDPAQNYKIVGKYKASIDSKAPSGIAYDSKNKVFFLKKGQKVHIGNFENGKFKSYYNTKLEYRKHAGYTHQGIATHNGRIYIPLWDEKGQNNSVIREYIVTKKSNTSYSIKFDFAVRYDNNTNKKDKFEMEGLDFSKSGQMFIVTNEENKREIYKVKFLYLYLGTNKISDNFTPLKSISSN